MQKQTAPRSCHSCRQPATVKLTYRLNGMVRNSHYYVCDGCISGWLTPLARVNVKPAAQAVQA